MISLAASPASRMHPRDREVPPPRLRRWQGRALMLAAKALGGHAPRLPAHAVQAQRNKTSLVTYLVQNKLVKSRALAEVAAEQFGVAYLDLHSIDKEVQPRDLVSEKLIRQHRALPLWRRGNKLFVAVSDPTNHQAVTDVQFSTGLNTEAILVEDDKLGEAIEKFFDPE